MNIILNGIVALMGVIVGAWLTSRRNDRERFLNAYDLFSNAFADAFRELENMEKIHAEVILSEFPKHEVAMYIFRRQLAFPRRWCFDRKWSEYKEAYTHYKKYETLMNSIKTSEASEEQRYREKILRLLSALLDIAKKY